MLQKKGRKEGRKEEGKMNQVMIIVVAAVVVRSLDKGRLLGVGNLTSLTLIIFQI